MNRRILKVMVVSALAFTTVGLKASWFSKKPHASTETQQQQNTIAAQTQDSQPAAASQPSADTDAQASTQSAQASQSNSLDSKSPQAAAELNARAAGLQNAANQNQPVDLNKLSYGIGYTLGQNFRTQKMDINVDQLIEGLRQGVSGQDAKFSKEEVRKMLMSYQRQVMQKRIEERQQQAQTNQQEGKKFLADNKSKSGVVELPSGLQYRVVEPGTGAKPSKEDTVSVTYSGRLINGEEFSASNDPANPIQFRVSGVIPAWQEALPLMTEGSTWEIFAPADLAYGARGAGEKIGPNATLIFKIKLVEVKKAQKEKAASSKAAPASLGTKSPTSSSGKTQKTS